MESLEQNTQNQNPTQDINVPLITNNQGIIIQNESDIIFPLTTKNEGIILQKEPSLSRIGEEYQAKMPLTQVGPTARCHLRMLPAVPIMWGRDHVPLPGLEPSRWSLEEKEIFLLGFYIFGKKLSLLKRFVNEKEGYNGKIEKMLSEQEEYNGKIEKMLSEQEGYNGKIDTMGSEQEGYIGKVETMEQGYNGKTETMEQGYNGKIETMDQGYNGKSETMEQGYNGKIETMEQGYNGKIETMEEGYNGKIETMEQGYIGKSETMEQGYIGKSETMEQGYNGKIKTMGDVLKYYYSEFYKSEGYNRYKNKRCVIGPCIFTGWRQLEILSRLLDLEPKEEHGTLQEVFNTYNEEKSSFEEFIFTLKSVTGTRSLVQVIGPGKGKMDLTRIRPDPTRARNQIQTRLEIPVGKQWSSLSSQQIFKILNGGFRLSKTRSYELFYEAIWPRLLVRGWTSYQQNDQPLVYLVPGIQIFSRENLIKGTHYFDSISDLLSKVSSDPDLIKDDENAPNCNNNDNIVNQEMEIVMKFTIIDTSLVQGQEGNNKVRSLRSLPLNALNEASDLTGQSQGDTSAAQMENKNIIIEEDNKEFKPKKEGGLAKGPVCRRRRLVECKKEKENYKKAPALLPEMKQEVCQPSLDLNLNLNLNLTDIKPESEIIQINNQEPCKKDLDVNTKKEGSSVQKKRRRNKMNLDVNTEKEGSSVENNRRHGTRNRPPTTKALEALALGFIGTNKKNKNREIINKRPVRRARMSERKNKQGYFGYEENFDEKNKEGYFVQEKNFEGCNEIQSE